MNTQRRNPKSPTFVPSYLERYAAEVDEWHREALAGRAARAARAGHRASGG